MAGKNLPSPSDPDGCVGADSGETSVAATKTSSCRSLVPSYPRSIALYPSAAHRNLHPSASTHHLQASYDFISDAQQRALYNTRMMSALQSDVAGYDQLQFPVTFQQLKNNTDLRLGPSSSSPSFSHPSMHRPHFSSFQMAHEFLECVRNVDVISDAENIKQLLKMPFDPQAEVSLIVHRIENTLLLDPFSVTQLEQHRTDWAWLQRFQALVFQRLINRDHCSAVAKLRSETQQRNRQLLLRMLQCTIQAAQQKYLATKGSHGSSPVEVPSVAAAPVPALDPEPSSAGSDACESPSTAVIPLNLTPAVPWHAETVSVCADEEVMPEPDASDQTPDTCYSDTHARKIIWNFEDVRMLIGTDLPIFGGDSHPCVSLRLHDMAKPITVLTGLDHWLDNLMCNVPEVAMCFHLSGIVQKYEMIKTEELPELTDSQFSPALVKDIAQNILAFLKVNTSEEGHTYWLFKKENDDVVKLYDLTNLKLGDEAPSASTPEPEACPDNGANLNPFTVPAGMLFYRVAKSLLQDPETRRRAATVTDLLHNAIKILQAHRYPEIVSSAHFYIAEVLMAEGYREHEEKETDSSADDYDSEPLPAGRPETANKKASGNKKNKKGKGSSATAAQTQFSDSRSGRRTYDDALKSIHLPQLCLSSTRQTFSRRYRRYRPPRLTQNFSARCTSALSHVAQGLQCILAKEKSKESKNRGPEGLQNPEGSPPAEEEPKMARRNESIPLPYEPIQLTQQKSSQASDSTQNTQRPGFSQENPQKSGQKTSDHSSIVKNANVSCDTYSSDAQRAQDRISCAGPHIDDGVSTKKDATQGNSAGCKEAQSSRSVDVEASSSRAGAGGPGAVVPSSAWLWVQLCSVRYGVSSLTAKLKLLLLHQAALGYKMIAADAFHSKQFARAADNVDLCVRCCVAVSHQLLQDTAHPSQQDYPIMKEALGLASEIFYEWAKVWDEGPKPAGAPNKPARKGGKRRTESRAPSTCEYNCTSAADGSDAGSDDEGLSEMASGKMLVILERLVPQQYRAQFEMPVSPSSAYACMMLSQCYLFLEAGGRLNSTSVLRPDRPGADAGGAVDLLPGCSLRLSFRDDMVRRSPDIVARLADVMNEMACFQINMVQSACMCGDERQCELLLDALAADQEHLTTAVSLFLKLGDTSNAAISLANLAKYHRLCAYFSTSRMKGTPMSEEEAKHHRQAAASYRQALWHLEKHIRGACDDPVAHVNTPKRRNLLKKEAGDKRSVKAQKKPNVGSGDRAECDATHLQADGCEPHATYEPRHLSVEQARDLSEKLKLDLVRTLTTHADGLCERGVCEGKEEEDDPVELLRESAAVTRTVLAESPSADCALLARNSLKIVALCSGLGRQGECKPAEWLLALQSLQAALFSRRHFTAALLCATSAVFSLLSSQAGITAECVRACVTCLVQSSYVVASYLRDPCRDLPLTMEDGRRFELTLSNFGLASPSQEILASSYSDDVEERRGSVAANGESADNNHRNSRSNNNNSRSNKGCNKSSNAQLGKKNTTEAKESQPVGAKNCEGSKCCPTEKEDERSKAGRSTKKNNRKGGQHKQGSSKNLRDGDADVRAGPHRPSSDAAHRTEECGSVGPSNGQRGAPEEGGGCVRSSSGALLLEFERCLRAALQKLCLVAAKTPQELDVAWPGCDAAAAASAYRAALRASADVAHSLMSVLDDVLRLLAIPPAPPDVLA